MLLIVGGAKFALGSCAIAFYLANPLQQTSKQVSLSTFLDQFFSVMAFAVGVPTLLLSLPDLYVYNATAPDEAAPDHR